MMFHRVLFGMLMVIMTGGTATAAVEPDPGVSTLRPEVLSEIPHDRRAFTQGLELAGDVLYEGTGLAGQSQLRELDPRTGQLRRAVPLPGRLFGEGITVVGDRIWQLTWRDGVALEWDRASLRLLRQVPLQGEGWGLCLDAGRGVLMRSDGTATLRFHDPATFAERGAVQVTLGGAPVSALNELECVDGQVWANVYQTERIVRIDPANGHVTAIVDAAGLRDRTEQVGADVLNGIAAADHGEFLLTGKHWAKTFRVRFQPRTSRDHPAITDPAFLIRGLSRLTS